MGRKYYCIVFMVWVLVVLSACASGISGEPTPRPHQILLSSSVPIPPSVVVGIPSKSNGSLVVHAESNSGDLIWSLIVDGEKNPSVSGGKIFEHTIALSGGVHEIIIVGENESGVQAKLSNTVVVDSTPPTMLEVSVAIEEMVATVKGKMSEAGTVICKGESVRTTPDGNFSLQMPAGKIGLNQIAKIEFYDEFGNSNIAYVEVRQSPNRWERHSSTGQSLQIVATPGFDPFDVNQVGVWRLLKGWGGDAWFHYEAGILHTPITEPVLWVVLRFLRWTLGSLLALIVIGVPLKNVVKQLKLLEKQIPVQPRRNVADLGQGLLPPGTSEAAEKIVYALAVNPETNTILQRVIYSLVQTERINERRKKRT